MKGEGVTLLGFGDKPKCSNCKKEIEGNDTVFIKMRYPKIKGFSEIKAYLRNNGEFTCQECFNAK